jgi:hypothetical protein
VARRLFTGLLKAMIGLILRLRIKFSRKSYPRLMLEQSFFFTTAAEMSEPLRIL